MSARLLSRIVFTDEKSRRNAHDYKIYGIHLEKDVQHKACQHDQGTGTVLDAAFHHSQSSSCNDGNHCGLHALHGCHNPIAAAKSSVEETDSDQDNHRGKHHAEHAEKTADRSSGPVTIEHSNIGNHGSRQAFGDAGQIQQLFIGVMRRFFLFFPFTYAGVSAIILITALFYRNESMHYEYCL